MLNTIHDISSSSMRKGNHLKYLYSYYESLLFDRKMYFYTLVYIFEMEMITHSQVITFFLKNWSSYTFVSSR